MAQENLDAIDTMLRKLVLALKKNEWETPWKRTSCDLTEIILVNLENL